MSKQDVQGFDISAKGAAVIGCGGLGSNICVHLAGAGIGRLYVCDFDTVNKSNLNRQFIYRQSDIGKAKAEAAKAFICAYAPDTEVIAVNTQIKTSEDLKFAESCDIIILAVDNIKARSVAEDFCKSSYIPLVSGGINGFFGNCYLFIPGKTPTLEDAGLLAADCVRGNISSSAGVIGALSCELAEKYLTGDYSCAGRLYVYDNCEIQSLEIKASLKEET